MEQILQYYETELDYMRRAFAEFEKHHPQKAKALGISAGKSTDADVQRLADSVALHAARLSKRLDDTLPETALDLINMVAPSFLLGAPSYAAVRLDADAETLGDPVFLKKDTVMPVMMSGDTPDCLFTVARDTQLNPCALTNASLERAPLRFDLPNMVQGCEAAICLTINPFDAGQGLSDFGCSSFEIYVSAVGGRKHRLIDVLAGDVIAVGYAPSRDGAAPAQATYMLPKHSFDLSMVQARSSFMPLHAAEPAALSRLRDFLAYPDKASYFTLSDTDGGFSKVQTGPVELRFFLSSQGAQKLSALEMGDISINVVPVINLYRDRSAPVRYDYARMQVPIKPDTATAMPVACLQICNIYELTPDGEVALPNITSLSRREDKNQPIWQERFSVGEFDQARREVSFSIPAQLQDDAPSLDIVADLYCSNGKSAFHLRPDTTVFFRDDRVAETPFRLLGEPSVAVMPDVSAERLWDILALINGNFATVFDADNPVEVLKESLHLAAPDGYCDAANAILDVNVSRCIAPVQIGRKVLLSAGSYIEVVFDVDALPFSKHVFASALHLYFTSLISYDRFFKLTLRERGRTAPFKTFKRQHGGQICG